MPYLPAAATGGEYLHICCLSCLGRRSSETLHALASGSIYWYFVLLNYVKEEDLACCSTACASLLTSISRQLQDRLTPLEALLQTRLQLKLSEKQTFVLQNRGSHPFLEVCQNVLALFVAGTAFIALRLTQCSLTWK